MDTDKVIAAYELASKRLLLIDYDGVLAPIMPLPEQAAPTKQTYDILARLTSDKRNVCVIVSGRPHDVLEEWLGHLPLSFAAEHGLWRKARGGDWTFAVTVPTQWKQSIHKTMSKYEAKLPGSFIEEKYAGVAFHYRNVKNADAAIQHLIDELQAPIANLSLRLIHGKKVVEIVPTGVDKGTAAEFWLESDNWEFILGAGDDTTDEALFKVLPPNAYSIKVGEGPTAARLRVSSQPAFMELLDELSNP